MTWEKLVDNQYFSVTSRVITIDIGCVSTEGWGFEYNKTKLDLCT
jgi:hypothetical protein